jgi:hypothetical protein
MSCHFSAIGCSAGRARDQMARNSILTTELNCKYVYMPNVKIFTINNKTILTKG